MGKVNHPDTLLSYIQSLEKRIAVLETQQRLSSARISSGQLNIGAADADEQIEIDADLQRIRFASADGATDLNAFGAGGAMLRSRSTAGGLFPFGTEGLIWDGPYFSTIQINRIDGDTSTVAAEIYADIQDPGGGQHSGSISLRAVGSDHDNSLIGLDADGGVNLFTNGRTTDPPAPGADNVVLYVKANRLYYRDGTGVVRGPL